MPALEPSHALHQTMELAKSLPKEKIVFLGRHGNLGVPPVVIVKWVLGDDVG